MSNAEDVALEIHESLFGDEPIDEEIEYLRSKMQAHTNQTLQELKEKVLDRIKMIKDFDNNHSKSRLTAFREVKTLIDEAINE